MDLFVFMLSAAGREGGQPSVRPKPPDHYRQASLNDGDKF